MLIVKDLGIEIGPRRILEPVSFVVGNGEKVGLVGRNGAGKSTLLSVLLGYHPEHLRISGLGCNVQGTLAHLPQGARPGGTRCRADWPVPRPLGARCRHP